MTPNVNKGSTILYEKVLPNGSMLRRPNQVKQKPWKVFPITVKRKQLSTSWISSSRQNNLTYFIYSSRSAIETVESHTPWIYLEISGLGNRTH